MKLRQLLKLLSFIFVVFVITITISFADTSKILNKRHNQVLLDPDISSSVAKDKLLQGVKVAECPDKYNVANLLNKKQSSDDIFKDLDKKVACARNNDYSGACWVQSVGFLNGDYRVKICNASSTGVLVNNQDDTCKILKAGESNGNFRAVAKNLGLEDVMYQGTYSDSYDACPDTTTNINGLGYVYIEEATDEKYTSADDFYLNYCEPLAQRFLLFKS